MQWILRWCGYGVCFRGAMSCWFRRGLDPERPALSACPCPFYCSWPANRSHSCRTSINALHDGHHPETPAAAAGGDDRSAQSPPPASAATDGHCHHPTSRLYAINYTGGFLGLSSFVRVQSNESKYFDMNCSSDQWISFDEMTTCDTYVKCNIKFHHRHNG